MHGHGNSANGKTDGHICREDESGASTSGGFARELLFGHPGIQGQVHRAVQRYVGQCNVQTDIKEACFMGGNDELVATGSDDGNVFIFNAATGRPVGSPRL